MESRFFRTRDGLRLHYINHPSVVSNCTSYCILLHGFTNDAHIWDPIANTLQKEHHVIALDLRGHGDSDWDPERKYSHWQLAEDLQDFLKELESVKLHVVGHSLGARVAMLALETTSCSIESLTIIDAGPEVNSEAGERLVNEVMQLPANYATTQDYLDCLVRIYVMADTSALKHIAKFGLRFHRGNLRLKTDPAFTPGIWHRNSEFLNMHMERGELSDQLWKALRSLDFPVHIVRGQASSILEPMLALKMATVLGNNGLLSVVPKAGHAVMLDNLSKSTAVITDFIHRTGEKRDKCEKR